MGRSNFLLKIYRALIYILPGILFFSYFPVIKIGANESMNFEFSLPLFWLIVFDAAAFVLLVQKKKILEVFKGWRFLLFPLFVTLSVVWSENIVRGVLTAGVMWLICFAMFALWILREEVKDEKFSRNFWKWFFGASLVMCLWCFLQCILDVVGVSREYTLMCAGCTSYSFGFPHPNGFAVEPQFMGNLLLAPTIVSGWMMIKQQKKYLVWMFLCFVATLFLTFSRGAIYAFTVAIIFMSVMMVVKEKKKRKKTIKRVSLTLLTTVIAFIFTLNLQGIFAQVGPTNDTYKSGVAKVLNHLSLGIIDIREQKVEVEDELSEKSEITADENEAIFDGYVEESTEIRKMLTRNALSVWRSDFKTILVGVGLGGAGQAMYKAGLIGSPKEIVQNQYASLLLEIGVVGILLLIYTVILLLRAIIKMPMAAVILTLGVAYGITLVFFAGLPNALHIYLLPILLALF